MSVPRTWGREPSGEVGRAEAAVAALRAMSAADATVIRDGEHRRVPASEIVPGDIILIEEASLHRGRQFGTLVARIE